MVVLSVILGPDGIIAHLQQYLVNSVHIKCGTAEPLGDRQGDHHSHAWEFLLDRLCQLGQLPGQLLDRWSVLLRYVDDLSSQAQYLRAWPNP